MGHEGYSGLSTKAKPFGQTTDFSPGGGKHNPKTVSLVKATQHLKKQFNMKALVIEIATVLFTAPLGLVKVNPQPESGEKQPPMNFWDILDSRC